MIKQNAQSELLRQVNLTKKKKTKKLLNNDAIR